MTPTRASPRWFAATTWLPSTPRQLLLYQALGLHAAAVRPRPAGGRPRRPAVGQAARRHAALGTADGRRAAGSAAGSAGVVVRLAGRGREPITARELIPLFRLDAIPPRPFVLTPELLRGIGYR